MDKSHFWKVWNTKYHYILLPIILMSGFLLRLYGIDSGLPYIYEPDESIMVDRAVIMLADHDPNPHWFGWPGTTAIYMLCLLYSFIFFVGRGLGVFENVVDFSTLFHQDPTIFYLSGRIMFMLFGVATIYITYVITLRIFNRDTGLVAAVLVALCPVHVLYSKIIRPDILLTFLTLVAFWFCYGILTRQTWKSYVLAGFFTGLAVATKYPAVIVVLLIIMAFVLSKAWHHAAFPKLIGSGIASLFGAFVASPFLFLDFKTVLFNLKHESRPVNLGGTGEGFVQNLVWYIQGPLVTATSTIGLIMSGIGIFFCVTSKQRNKWLLIAFPVFYVAFMASLDLRWTRAITPCVPFLCIIIAHSIYKTTSWIGQHGSYIAGKCACIILFLVIAVPLLRFDILKGSEMSGTNTRTLAREWMLENIPKGSSILVEKYTPHLPRDWYRFLEVQKNGRIVEVDSNKIEEAVFRPSWRFIGNLKNVNDIRSQNVEYMVLGEYYDRYFSERERYSRYSDIVATYDVLMKAGTLVYEGKSIRGKNTGSRIRIYKFEK